MGQRMTWLGDTNPFTAVDDWVIYDNTENMPVVLEWGENE